MWQIKNATLTREFCKDLFIQLKQTHLDPVLQQLRGKEGAKLSFDDIIGVYNRIKDEYGKSAIGAKDVIAAVFFEFHPVSQGSGLHIRPYDFTICFEQFQFAEARKELHKVQMRIVRYHVPGTCIPSICCKTSFKHTGTRRKHFIKHFLLKSHRPIFLKWPTTC